MDDGVMGLGIGNAIRTPALTRLAVTVHQPDYERRILENSAALAMRMPSEDT